MIAVPYKNVWILCLVPVIVLLCQSVVSDPIGVGTTLTPKLKALLEKANVSNVRELLNSRRILNGREAGSDKPYMVYLKLPRSNVKFQDYNSWLCGGVILSDSYILTSAACIEDVRHFYVVAGTNKYSPDGDKFNNPCIKNGAKKAIWKCIPRNYIFDGHENDNIRWMSNDIAVVKTDEEFDFTRKVRGCDYIPKPICYNNNSLKLEAADSLAMIAGWGSTDKYNDWANSRKQSEREQVSLLETDVTLMDKHNCKKRWGHRYANIIENYMICTRDISSELSEVCQEKYVDCQDIEEDSNEVRRNLEVGGPDHLHSAYHNNTLSRRWISGGGFCENDHGGPIVAGQGVNSVVIGVISACLVREKTNKCYGPFLYTSVYKNRNMINCAINKDIGGDCNKMYRAGSTHTEVELSWVDHPDGPSKNDIKKLRRNQEESKLKSDTIMNATQASITAPTPEATTKSETETKSEVKREGLPDTSTPTQAVESTNKTRATEQVSDKVMQHSGLVLRSGPELPV